MKIVIFGLAISSSWGNGHATIWRGLARALHKRGHKVVFFERDAPHYASSRDMDCADWVELVIYPDWERIRRRAELELVGADVAMVTSYCADGRAASELALSSGAAVKCFYDLDAPITLKAVMENGQVMYLPPEGLGGFDLVLSYTGGKALEGLARLLGAVRVAPLYGSVDPSVHSPGSRVDEYASDLSYLGTYSSDRRSALTALFVEPARRAPGRRFVLGGSLYPGDFPWTRNIFYISHVPPPRHPAFYSSSLWTLNATRGAMAEMGYCPSGRLFEAAACEAPVVSDGWDGLEEFFAPGQEIVVAESAEEVLGALTMSEWQRRSIARNARERALAEHTSDARAAELERLIEGSARHAEGACGE